MNLDQSLPATIKKLLFSSHANCQLISSSFYFTCLGTTNAQVCGNYFNPFDFGDQGAELLLKKNGLYNTNRLYFDLKNYDPKTHLMHDRVFRYKDVLFAWGEFFRVVFEDGRVGWADKEGNEYPDPKN